ncbi:MAG: ferrous iron transport protein A [Anaerolineales bacterium]
MEPRSLSELMVGQTGAIVKLSAIGASRQRLLDMGVVRGELIEVIRTAPLGDPIEYRIKGYHLSLRKHEARLILVEVRDA